MTETDYNTMKSKAESMGLNWSRMFGVTVERYGDVWDGVQATLEDCLEQAEAAMKDGRDPQPVVRARLIQCMIGQIEDLMDDGVYDYDE
jgi:hypothetical protein